MIKKMPNISTIEAGQGLGDLKFGLERKDVELILGAPDEIETFSFSEDDEDDMTENWHYDALELSLSFDDSDDWRLGTISITSSQYLLKGFAPIGLSKDELESKLEALGVDDLEYDDWSPEETPVHELMASDSLGINFWFDEDKLSEVQWAPLFLDEETIIWPEIK